MGIYGNILDICINLSIECIFMRIYAYFAASPAPIKEAAFGRLHNGGPAAFGRRPTIVESFMEAGEAAKYA